VGVAPWADAPKDTVVTIDNWTTFAQKFIGDATEGTHLSSAVYGLSERVEASPVRRENPRGWPCWRRSTMSRSLRRRASPTQRRTTRS
jgi:hypothetical protein